MAVSTTTSWRSDVRAVLLLLAAVVQALAPTVVGFDDTGSDPVVVPPGPFFAVWGVVIAGCLLTALRGLPRERAGSPIFRAVQIPLSMTQVLFVVWLLAARIVPRMTVAVFAVMLVLLVRTLRSVLSADADGVTRWLVGGTVGIYAGWSSTAIWINAVTVLPEAQGSGRPSVAVQVAAVAGATLTAVGLAWVTRGWPPYVLTAAWALVGVTLSALMAEAAPLWIASLVGLALVAVTTVVAMSRGAVAQAR